MQAATRSLEDLPIGSPRRVRPGVMVQRWEDLSFVHWAFEPEHDPPNLEGRSITEEILALACDSGAFMEGMDDPTEEQCERLRSIGWAHWVADLRTVSSPGFLPLPWAAVEYDGVPDNIDHLPVFAMPGLVQWMKDREASTKNAVRFNVKTKQLEPV